MNLNFLEFIKKKIIINKFKKFNKKIFLNNEKESKKEILVEFNAFHSDHIFLAYLSNFFSKKYKAKIVGFYNLHLIVSSLNENLIKKIKWYISSLVGYKNFGIYESFGTCKFIKPKISLQQKYKALNFYKKSIKKIKSKGDVYKISINNVLIGDLIYDSYLKYYYYPTVKIHKSEFKSYLLDFYCLFFFWFEYFKNSDVKAVVGVHGQYSYAILQRIAIHNKIPVLLHKEGKIWQFNKKNLYQHKEYLNYKKIFHNLNKIEKKKALQIGEKIIKNRTSGAIGNRSGQSYISVSSFSKKDRNNNVLQKNNKIKVLISTQDFFDSINVYGRFLFYDFYDWINFMGRLSEKTDYDWYIKDHPNYGGKYQIYQPFTSNITKEIVKKYKNIKYLNPNTSHHQIISEGIDYVCTVYGSIAFEYPYFNIPVITATKNCPTIKYNFNIHPRNKKNYEKILLNLKKKKFKFNKNEIREFYYMNFYYHSKSYLLSNYKTFVDVHKKWDLYWSEKFYDYWYKNWTKKQHTKMYDTISNFYNSSDLCNNITHTNYEKNN